VINQDFLDAVKKNDIEAARHCLQNGADVNYRKTGQLTAFMYAVKKRNLDMMKMLVENHADINATTKSGSALTMLVQMKNIDVDVLDYLLELECNLSLEDAEGHNALWHTFENNGLRGKSAHTYKELFREDIMKKLWDAGARHVIDSKGNHAALFARRIFHNYQDSDMEKYYEEHPAIIHHRNDSGKTVLYELLYDEYITSQYQGYMTFFF